MKIGDYIIFFTTLLILGASLVMFTLGAEGDSDGPDVFDCGVVSYKVTSHTYGTVEVVGFINSPGLVEIPETVMFEGKEYTVTSVKGSAFEGCVTLWSLKIPKTVETLGRSAFKDCVNLIELSIPASLDSVSSEARPVFEGCKGIVEVTLTEGTGDCFDYGKNRSTPWQISKGSFETLIISEGVKSIGANTFSGCDGLKNIRFLGEVEYLGEGAFEGITFFDVDGSTILDASADNLSKSTFTGTNDKMVKQKSA